MLIKQLRRVNMVIEGNGGHQIIPAALTDSQHAIYSADGRLYLVKIAPTSMNSLYTADSGHVVLGGCSDSDPYVIELLLHKLHHMTAYQFLTKVIVALKDETTLDLVKHIQGC